MAAYYNEFDPYAAQWLRNLIAAGHIAPGDVDERSIVDVRADDLRGYTQCHFFSGIAGWSLALRLAMWPDDRPVWTGSCPCQPFSAAGKQRGTEDERHLWPVFHRLIAECRPPVVFGEQVASKLGRDWLCGVRADLEALGYAVGAADLCAAGVGAPHIRQRLWWVADSTSDGRREERPLAGRFAEGDRPEGRAAGLVPSGDAGGLGHADDAGPQGRHDGPREGGRADQWAAGPTGESGGMADAERHVTERHGHEVDGAQGAHPSREEQRQRLRHEPVDGGSVGFWSDAVSIPCSDGKTRRAQPGIFPLAHGVPGRVGRLRAYGNAIVPPLAAQFITAWMDI